MARIAIVLLLCAAVLFAVPFPGNAEERTVSGTITVLDRKSRSVSVRDGMGSVWNYRVDEHSGIDLAELRIGDYVTVTIERGTPLNMNTPADILRKGDRIVRFPGK